VELRAREPARLSDAAGAKPRATPARRPAAGLVVLLAVIAAGLASPPPAASQELEVPSSPERPPAGYELSSREVTAIARGPREVAEARREHGPLDPTAYTHGTGRWQVSFFANDDEVAQVHVDDATGAVLEAWNGPQVAWRMARGYEGAFGGTLNAPYVWLPLCAVFLLPFIDPRRPFRMLHLDLLVLLGFGASHVFFNRGEIDWSAPLVYPVLAYLLARMMWTGFRPGARREKLVPFLPATALLIGVLFLVGFRVALNVADSRVIDVGYAGVVGADVIADGDGLYERTFPGDIDSGDTYGPVNYLAYLPFEQVFDWSGEWDDLPAAHGAAIAFDVLTILGLFLLGRRLRAGPEGRMLGAALAFAWASYPYTAYVLGSNANDSLVAMLIVYSLLAVNSAPARGMLLGLASASKFAPLALAPLFARGVDRPPDEGKGPPPRGRARDLRGPAVFAVAFLATVLAAALIFMPDGGARELYDRTLGYQAGRDSPFSVWGQVPSLGWLHTAVKAAVVALGVAVAFVPRRRGPVQLAALGGAVLIALQIAMTHWFYLYVVWFLPLVLVAIFARHRPDEREAAAAAETAKAAQERVAVPA
jgi:Glycosyltransferase family 87